MPTTTHTNDTKPKEFSFSVTKQPKKKKIVNLDQKLGGSEEEDWSIVTCWRRPSPAGFEHDEKTNKQSDKKNGGKGQWGWGLKGKERRKKKMKRKEIGGRGLNIGDWGEKEKK